MYNQGKVFSPKDDERPDKTKQYLIEKLDRADSVIKNIREEAKIMVDYLDSVYRITDAVKNSKTLNNMSVVDKEDINQISDRIIKRCNTVDIKVHNTRSDSQQNCLVEINSLIDKIVSTIKNDPDGAKSTCESYLASCSLSENESGSKIFKIAVLGCTLDDQKHIYT